MYTEVSSSIDTGLAVANTANSAATIRFDLYRLDGSATGLTATLPLNPGSQTALFVDQIGWIGTFPFRATPFPPNFQGIIRVSSDIPVAVMGLRGHYNERNDFLITTLQPVSESTPLSSNPLYFPHIVDSGGFTTQFILFNAQPNAVSSGTVQFFSQAGSALNVSIH
jgi:hypothetical protein